MRDRPGAAVTKSNRGSGGPTGALGARLRRGAALSGAALAVVQLVTFGQTLVLARLLSPAEVGLFAAGTVLGVFLMVVAEGALSQALIQRGGDVRDAAETVFWVTFGGAAVMAAGVLAAAPLVAAVFGDPTAGAIAAVTSGTMVLYALTHVPEALMQRRLDFRRRVVVDPAAAATFALVAVVFAVLGHGVWALVIAQYAMVTVRLVVGSLLAGWRPGRGRPSLRLWWEMARFGVPLLVGSLVERGRDALELAVVGRALDTSALGNYRYGRRIAVLPGVLVIEAGAFVLFPAFARIADDPDRLKQAFLRALAAIWSVALPVAGAIVACGQALAVLLLGDPWRGAGVVLTAMAGLGVGQALNAVTVEAMKGAGHSARINWMTGVGLVSGVGLLVLLVPLGLVGVGLAVSGAALAVGLTGLCLVRTVVRVSTSELAARLVPPIVAVAPTAAAVAILERWVVQAATWPTWIGLGLVAAEVLAVGLAYCAVLHLVAPELTRAVLDLVRVRRSTN
jgi:O-antigen/teichoic acid export membrane protein